MADAFLGEIRIFAGNFAPKNWALCNGQIMSVQQNTALFSLLGTLYGGDGKTTFALPNLIGAAPMQHGTGQGLTAHTIGTKFGTSTETLLAIQMPVHTHIAKAKSGVGTSKNSTDCVWAEAISSGKPPTQPSLYGTNINATMNPAALSSTGGNQPHNNMQPYLVLNYIICLQGEFPLRG